MQQKMVPMFFNDIHKGDPQAFNSGLTFRDQSAPVYQQMIEDYWLCEAFRAPEEVNRIRSTGSIFCHLWHYVYRR